MSLEDVTLREVVLMEALDAESDAQRARIARLEGTTALLYDALQKAGELCTCSGTRKCWDRGEYVDCPYCEFAYVALASVPDKVKELLLDKARIDWLDMQGPNRWISITGRLEWRGEKMTRWYVQDEDRDITIGEGEAVRAAIDSAMGAKEESNA